MIDERLAGRQAKARRQAVAILDLRAAIRRTEERMAEIEALYPVPPHCCPSCACGPEWHALAAKLERQAQWLATLLRKQGDEAGARGVEFDYL